MKKGEKKMTNGRLIKVLATEEGITMTELARRLGISRAGLYKRLEGEMRTDKFKECLKELGYE